MQLHIVNKTENITRPSERTLLLSKLNVDVSCFLAAENDGSFSRPSLSWGLPFDGISDTILLDRTGGARSTSSSCLPPGSGGRGEGAAGRGPSVPVIGEHKGRPDVTNLLVLGGENCRVPNSIPASASVPTVLAPIEVFAQLVPSLSAVRDVVCIGTASQDWAHL
ncbi:unnamed protein product [Phytophthora fragariaefolia]|uniref:Unnamed protein product n=1 Tax=Phytophthora fragariaefolia TaxID=1490495 RepID=A0A9W6YPB1_9STRA|nr:unnamed protein product [Phytophthora fragariaefolia]